MRERPRFEWMSINLKFSNMNNIGVPILIDDQKVSCPLRTKNECVLNNCGLGLRWPEPGAIDIKVFNWRYFLSPSKNYFKEFLSISSLY